MTSTDQLAHEFAEHLIESLERQLRLYQAVCQQHTARITALERFAQDVILHAGCNADAVVNIRIAHGDIKL